MSDPSNDLEELAKRIEAAENFEKLSDEERQQNSIGKDYAKGSRIATRIIIELSVPLASGAWIGHWLDGKFDKSPWLTIIFTLLGFITGIMNMIRYVNKQSKDIF